MIKGGPSPIALFAALLSPGLIGPAEGCEPESAGAFLRRMYAPYLAADTTADPTG